MQLSKSDYMMFLKHPAWLWLKKHDKDRLPPIDPGLQAMFDAGHAFEPYAESLFAGGVTVGFDFNDRSRAYNTMPARTKAELDMGVNVIFQGRLEYGETTCIFDVLERIERNRFHLYEIKSATKDKPEYVDDLAFQKLVLEGAGLVIELVSVIVVNNDYVRNGEVDAKLLTKVIDLTDKVNNRMESTREDVAKALEVLKSPTMPDLSPRHAHQQFLKDWLEVFLVLKLDTDPYSIYRLSGMKGDLIGELEDQGIERLHDLPDSYQFGNGKHQRQLELVKHGQPIVQREQIDQFLGQLQFPLYFFDYETMSSVVPAFDGTRPYQNVPVQYSLHILHEPNGELEHREFLHTEHSNPGLDLVAQLQQDIGTSGSIVVWYATFEKSRNDDLGEMFPEFADFMEKLNDRVVDLMIPFSEGWYEDYRFLGSASIKKVLPILVPELSYKSLAIQEGQTASRLWVEAVIERKHEANKQQLFADMLAYCKLDTLAMVKIWEFLSNPARPR